LNGKIITATSQLPRDDGTSPDPEYYFHSMFFINSDTATFTIKNGTLNAGGDPNVTPENSPLKNRAIMVYDGTINVRDLTIKNAILCEDDDGPTISYGAAIAIVEESDGGEAANVANIIDSEIKDCALFGEDDIDGDGGAIGNQDTLTLNNVKISNCNTCGSGGAIYSPGTLLLTKVEISDCVAGGDGGAIYCSKGSDITLDNQTKITNCKANEGGAIYFDTSEISLTINGATISNCEATCDGGAIYFRANGDVGLIFNGGTISGCKGAQGSAIYMCCPNDDVAATKINTLTIKDCVTTESFGGAIFLRNDECKLVLGKTEPTGTGIVFNNNVDKDGNKNDISFRNSPEITVKENFATANKIYLAQNNTDDEEEYKAIAADGYDYTTKPLKNSFACAKGDQYLEIDDENINKLVFKVPQNISIVNPEYSNDYTAGVNGINDTLLTATYQWYSSPISDIEQIGDYGQYTVNGNVFEVKDNDADIGWLEGDYDSTNKVWISDETDGDAYVFRIDGLKVGQSLMFDYDIGDETTNIDAYLEAYIGSTWKKDLGEIDIDQSTPISPSIGTYSYVVEEDGYSYLIYFWTNNSDDDKTTVTLSNIRVIDYGEGTKLEGETSNKINKPLVDSGNYCEVSIVNDDGVSKKYNTNRVIIQSPIQQDVTEVVKGTSREVTMRFEATHNEYEYFNGVNGVVYLDGISDDNKLTKGTDYTVSEGSIILKLSKDFVSSLDTGTHTLFVKKSDTAGKEMAIANLKVNNPAPTPPAPIPPEDDPPVKKESTSGGKDTTCEAVIGPRWHWNQKTGKCEEYLVVNTSVK